MKFRTSSFLLGVGVAAAAFASRERLRPVVVEMSALGLHLARIARGLYTRHREDLEDLWAEVDERVHERAAEARRRRAPAEETYVDGHHATR